MLKYQQKFLCQKTAKANLFLRILITRHNYTQLACTMADTVLGNSNCRNITLLASGSFSLTEHMNVHHRC